VAIQLYLQTEDKQMAELLLWLEDREGFTIDDKLALLDRTSHWLTLADPAQHLVFNTFPTITVDVDGQRLTASTLSGIRFQSEEALPSQAQAKVEV
jgi:hypothetical protein